MCTASSHVALVAFPFGSHPAALFHVARALSAAKPPGAAFSFLSTAASLGPLASDGDNLRLVAIDDGVPDGLGPPPPPPSPEVERRIGMFLEAAAAGGIMEGVKKAEAAAGGVAVSCVVSDAFMWMAAEVAAQLGVPWVPLWPGATSALLAHLNTDLIRRTIGVGAQVLLKPDDPLHIIPGLATHRLRDLPEGIVSGDLDSLFHRLLHRMSEHLPRATVLVLNTFSGLDPLVDADLATVFPTYLPIGPNHLRSSPPAASDPFNCLTWLDSHKPRTVAYVAFGTTVSLPPHELRELALGLEESNAPFLWSLKEKERKNLPPGFLERTKERGLIVSWAPQVAALRHEAVGAMVGHAGWNSVLEAMSCGAPMACRPFFGDHGMAARSVSHVWGVGLEFDGGALTKDRVVAALDVLLRSEEGRRMREKAGELKRKVLKAFEGEQGSSNENFSRFVKIVCGL
ncbi:anthocyanidin 3-O-glucosyltransferase-like [Typha angustifolia]|uniref:anthocyanidin 3-O-glucosyltransferase-like n=1 Tax=Typha angustifolia TaxID=59011 RepID=UPI003C2FCF28